MRIPLSRFTLHSPDELLPHWFVSENFAELLGVEYSSDAAKVVRHALAGARAEIEDEADAVTIRIRASKNVMPTLRQLYDGLGWDAAELDAIEPRVAAFKRPKPVAIAVGDVFVVPLTGDEVGVGQILDLQRTAPTVAILRWLGTRDEAARLDVASVTPLTIIHTLGTSLLTGAWPIVGRQGVTLDPASGPDGARNKIGAQRFGGDGPVVAMLELFAGREMPAGQLFSEGHLRRLFMV